MSLVQMGLYIKRGGGGFLTNIACMNIGSKYMVKIRIGVMTFCLKSDKKNYKAQIIFNSS